MDKQVAIAPPSQRARRALDYWLGAIPALPAFPALQQCWAAKAERSFMRVPEPSGLEVWLIGWPPGTGAPLHDHGLAAGVAASLSGRLNESLRTPSGEWSMRTWTPGLAVHLPRGVCHQVSNDESETAFSVHVYEPRLSFMTYYHRTSQGSLRPLRIEHAHQWQPAP